VSLVLDNAIFLQGLVFLLVAGALLAAGGLFGGYDRLLEARIRGLCEAERPKERPRRALDVLLAKLSQLRRVLPSDEKGRSRLQKRLNEAGIHDSAAVAIYFAAKCLLTLILPAVWIAAGALKWMPDVYAWVGAGVAALIGLWLPHLWLEHRRNHRHLTLRRALPDFLDLIVACLGGGLSVQAALRQVAEELKIAHRELSQELLVVLREIELGRSLDVSLQQLAVRTGLEEMRTLCSFVHQTTKFGTTITDALASLAEMLRIQREQRAEELAQKAAVKILFPTLLFIFPTVFVVLAGPAAIQIREGLAANKQGQASSVSRK